MERRLRPYLEKEISTLVESHAAVCSLNRIVNNYKLKHAEKKLLDGINLIQEYLRDN